MVSFINPVRNDKRPCNVTSKLFGDSEIQDILLNFLFGSTLTPMVVCAVKGKDRQNTKSSLISHS